LKAIGTKGYETLTGLAPAGKGDCEFKISLRHIQHFEINGPEYKFYELLSVAETLKSPLIIAEGLNRQGYERALCYIAKPKRHGSDWEGPPPPKMVFLVCMTQDFKIFEWRWEKEDSERCNYPEDAGRRFTRIIWPR
jgi:hypothetical protein